jgi:hypothetical protein
MPSYTSNSQAKLLYENAQEMLWENELVPTGQLSIAFQIRRTTGTYYFWGLSFEVIFAADPGAFEIDLMGANTDKRQNYVLLGTITTVNTSFVGRWDMPTSNWPKYIAGYVNTLTNAVNVTLQVTR